MGQTQSAGGCDASMSQMRWRTCSAGGTIGTAEVDSPLMGAGRVRAPVAWARDAPLLHRACLRIASALWAGRQPVLADELAGKAWLVVLDRADSTRGEGSCGSELFLVRFPARSGVDRAQALRWPFNWSPVGLVSGTAEYPRPQAAVFVALPDLLGPEAFGFCREFRLDQVEGLEHYAVFCEEAAHVNRRRARQGQAQKNGRRAHVKCATCAGARIHLALRIAPRMRDQRSEGSCRAMPWVGRDALM